MTFDPLFRKHVKEVLEHLYDTAYLETHPLLSVLLLNDTTSQVTRAQKLRGLIKDLIETLRPQQGSPSSSPEWRSYLALRSRYVMGMSSGQVESELGISLRQLQRETHKGLDALAALLWQQRVDKSGPPDSTRPAETGEVEELQQELDQWVFNRRPCDVRSLIEDVLWMRQSIPEQQAVTIAVNLSGVLPPVMVDATLTRQALFKLVRLVGQGVAGEIHLTAQSSNRAVELLISHPSACLNCQEADWRIAELLLEQQGGSLRRVDAAGGIQVYISLPRLEQSTVLVVDDNPALHQLFERYLAPSNYTVLHAFNGAEALQMADTNQPDFITLDVMMASVDGWQVLRDLQLNPRTVGIPVIVCSVLREPDLALSLGAKAYLKKPVERLQLQQALEQLRAGHPASRADT